MSVPAPSPAVDVLHDAQRVAAARRLLLEVPGPAAYDRLSGLAARLLGAGHAKVTLFTDQDTVVGGHRLPPGVVGGRAQLTGVFSECVVREGRALVVPDARRLLVRAREVLVRTGSREQTLAAVREDYPALADAHEEAYDSAAVEEVAFELDRMLRAAGLREVDALEEVAP